MSVTKFVFMAVNLFESKEYYEMVKANDQQGIQKMIKKHVSMWWQFRMLLQVYHHGPHLHKRYKRVIKKMIRTTDSNY